MNTSAILAIFKRNLFAYFGNPTGYVFICAFVLVSGLAAFWPHEFFNANLANLDQLNKVIHLILLGFIPAITMSIWADERRQGTDELLLTLPASDLDVVVGKYLAAVSIFTVSLLFSLSNVVVLSFLGDPDPGLMVTTFLGYWFMGLTMLAIGMVASFLTGNLTVAFVLGVAFNVPLVLAGASDVFISGGEMTQSIREWSLHAHFLDFSRGVVSLSSIVYFGAIVASMLYLAAVLIGRRHWATGGAGQVAAGHYLIRVVALLVSAASLTLAARHHDARADWSTEKLSSLSPESIKLLDGLGDRGIRIEAFVSPEAETPESYIQTRLNLLTMLDELSKHTGGRIAVTVNETESFKPAATVAERRYGITAQNVFTRERGKFKQGQLYLGVAIVSGLDKEVVPFVDRGVPVEYELVRSIVAVSQDARISELQDEQTAKAEALKKARDKNEVDSIEKLEEEEKNIQARLENSKRKVLGVVKTDSDLMGTNPNRQAQFRQETHPLIEELRKQYEVKEVDLEQVVEWKGADDKAEFDAFLAAQPSTLSPAGMTNLISLIRQGAPVALFEDPEVVTNGAVAGTREPRRPVRPPQMPGMRMPQQPMFPPTGDVNEMWDLLGISSLKAEEERNLQALEVRDELWRMATLNLPTDSRRREIMNLLGEGLEGFLQSNVENEMPRVDPDDPDAVPEAVLDLDRQKIENRLVAEILKDVQEKAADPRASSVQKELLEQQAKLFSELLELGKTEFAKRLLKAEAGKVAKTLEDGRNDAHKTRNSHILWQKFNPFPKLDSFSEEFIFASNGAGGNQPGFNPEHPVSSGLQHLLLLHAGGLHWRDSTGLKHNPLVRTGAATGTTDLASMIISSPFGLRRRNPHPDREKTGEQYVLALHITGRPEPKSGENDLADTAKDLMSFVGNKAKEEELEGKLKERAPGAASAVRAWLDKALDLDKLSGDLKGDVAGAKKAAGALESSASSLNQLLRIHGEPLKAVLLELSGDSPKMRKESSKEFNVILVSDMDLLAPDFFRIRASGGIRPDMGLNLDVDNVSFILNIVDYLAKDDRFLEIRKKRRLHRTLTSFEQRIRKVREKTRDLREKFKKDFESENKKATEELKAKQKQVLSDAQKIGGFGFYRLTPQQQSQLEVAKEQADKALEVRHEQLERTRDEAIRIAEADLELEIRTRQNSLKRMAVFLPPMLPLALGLGVWGRRKSRELAGVNERRLRNHS